MPKISCAKEVFFKLLGTNLSLEQLDELGFEYGMEIEEEEEGQKLVFEIAANRPDLLCVESLAYNLRLYLGLQQIRKFTFLPPKERIIVKKNTQQVRPFVVGAVLRNVTLDQNSYESFISLQDKLHQNFWRKRKLASVGTHDLDTIKGPFVYDALPPTEIKFKALKQTEEMDAAKLFEILEADQYLKPYLSIIKDSPVFPVFLDSNNIVLSLPPIINGEHSKISPQTKNILIEVTCLDYQRALAGLACLVSCFSQYCQEQFTIEMVEIVNEQTGEVQVTPQADERVLVTSMKYINGILGINVANQDVEKLLQKMGVESKVVDDSLSVQVPFYRSDILQQCDVAEDIAIAYGYNNIKFQTPEVGTCGGEYRLNKLSDLVREEVAVNGFVECLNFVLCSMDEQTNLLSKHAVEQIVHISNSKSLEFQCSRATLITQVLKTLKNNSTSKLPIQIFEVADVVVKGYKTSDDPVWVEGEGQVGALNNRRLCALVSEKDKSGLDIIHGLLDQIMLKLKIENNPTSGYHIQKPTDQSNYICFFTGLQASIMYKNQEIGMMGVLHPVILENLKWDYPTSLIEINLEPLFRDFK